MEWKEKRRRWSLILLFAVTSVIRGVENVVLLSILTRIVSCANVFRSQKRKEDEDEAAAQLKCR